MEITEERKRAFKEIVKHKKLFGDLSKSFKTKSRKHARSKLRRTCKRDMRNINDIHAEQSRVVRVSEDYLRWYTYTKPMEDYNPYYLGIFKKGKKKIAGEKAKIEKEAVSEFIRFSKDQGCCYLHGTQKLCKLTKLKMQVIRNAKAAGVPQNQIEY